MSRSRKYRARVTHWPQATQDVFLRLLDTPEPELRMALDALDSTDLHDVSTMTGNYCRSEFGFQEAVRAACRSRNRATGGAWPSEVGPSSPPIHTAVDGTHR